ncbi:unnamed protein product [Ascophyllum nodosum]
MTDAMFMEWLQHRLTPAFNEVFPGKKMILVLDNASYHHGCDAEVRVPETNTKKYNVGLLRSYKARSIKCRRSCAGNSPVFPASSPRKVDGEGGNLYEV